MENLDLHDAAHITVPQGLPFDVWVLKVPGGFIYTFYEQQRQSENNLEWKFVGSEFVPEQIYSGNTLN